MDKGAWSEKSRKGYNLEDAVARSTVQVRVVLLSFWLAKSIHRLLEYYLCYSLFCCCCCCLLYEGISESVDGDIHRAGQRGHVEREVAGLGAQVPGPAVLPPGVHAHALPARRATHPSQRHPLRPCCQQKPPRPPLPILSCRALEELMMIQSVP